ncbi:hypothetical protein AB1Y20_000209 [Prymnesium parvum]|uniref:Amine oxidase n=1 Tax=Prymnesium parvum TaxID=97485 RepID=A0AB34K9B1_PRYPA
MRPHSLLLLGAALLEASPLRAGHDHVLLAPTLLNETSVRATFHSFIIRWWFAAVVNQGPLFTQLAEAEAIVAKASRTRALARERWLTAVQQASSDEEPLKAAYLVAQAAVDGASADSLATFEDICHTVGAVPLDEAGTPLWRDYVISNAVPHVEANVLNPALLPAALVDVNGSAAVFLAAMRYQLDTSVPWWPGSDLVTSLSDSRVALSWLQLREDQLEPHGGVSYISSESLFPDAPFDCLQTCSEGTKKMCFGLEDPRLLSLHGVPYLLVHTRHHLTSDSVPCNVSREEGLRPYVVPLRRASSGAVEPATGRVVALRSPFKVSPFEKNWVLFECGAVRVCAVYQVYPSHVVVHVDPYSGVVAPLANSTSSALFDQIMSAPPFHGGAGAVRMEGSGGSAPYFLSAAHSKSRYLKIIDHDINVYGFHLYKFRATFPYDVFAVAKLPLPLNSSLTPWGFDVAFVTSLVLHNNSGEQHLLISYGCGDRESRVFDLPLRHIDAFDFVYA